MKRKTSTLETRIYSFGCLSPVQAAYAEHNQLWLAHRYYNALVKIDRTRRARYRVARRYLLADFAALEAELDSALCELKSATKATRSDARSRVKSTKEHLRETKQTVAVGPGNKVFSTRVAAMVASGNSEDCSKDLVLSEMMTEDWPDYWKASATFTRRVARLAQGGGPRAVERSNAAVLADMMTESWPRLWKLTRRIDAAATRSMKRTRATSGLSWGTYLLVDAAVARARADSLVDIKWHRFDGSGQLGVQINGGMDLSTFTRINPQLWIQCSDSGEWGALRSRRNAIVAMRMGTEDGKPIHALWPFIMHRDLPPDALIKEARMQFRRDARLRRELQLVVESAQHGTWIDGRRARRRNRSGRVVELPPQTTKSGELSVSISRDLVQGDPERLGARFRSDTLGSGMVVVHPTVASRLEYCDALQSIQDQLFATAHPLAIALAHDIPEHLQHEAKSIARWKSRGRLSRFVGRLIDATIGRNMCSEVWASWRASQPSDLFPSLTEAQSFLAATSVNPREQTMLYLDWWRRKDRHIDQWRAGLRIRAIRRRNSDYRVWARQMADSHISLVLEADNLRPTRRKLHIRGDTDQQPLTVVRSSLVSVDPPEDIGPEANAVTRELGRARDPAAAARKRSEIAARRAQMIRSPGVLKRYLLEAFGPTRVTSRKRPGDAETTETSRTAASGLDNAESAAE